MTEFTASIHKHLGLLFYCARDMSIVITVPDASVTDLGYWVILNEVQILQDSLLLSQDVCRQMDSVFKELISKHTLQEHPSSSSSSFAGAPKERRVWGGSLQNERTWLKRIKSENIKAVKTTTELLKMHTHISGPEILNSFPYSINPALHTFHTQKTPT